MDLARFVVIVLGGRLPCHAGTRAARMAYSPHRKVSNEPYTRSGRVLHAGVRVQYHSDVVTPLLLGLSKVHCPTLLPYRVVDYFARTETMAKRLAIIAADSKGTICTPSEIVVVDDGDATAVAADVPRWNVSVAVPEGAVAVASDVGNTVLASWGTSEGGSISVAVELTPGSPVPKGIGTMIPSPVLYLAGARAIWLLSMS